MPRMDDCIKSPDPQTAKAVDKELARIQTFVLDALAPLTAMLENVDQLWVHYELIGNANARMSRLQREKLVGAINKQLLPLVKEDADFSEAAPNLLGPDFSKWNKDFLDQVKALRSSLPMRGQDPPFCT